MRLYLLGISFLLPFLVTTSQSSLAHSVGVKLGVQYGNVFSITTETGDSPKREFNSQNTVSQSQNYGTKGEIVDFTQNYYEGVSYGETKEKGLKQITEKGVLVQFNQTIRAEPSY